MGHGPVGAGVRVQLVEPARTPSTGGGCLGGPALRDGTSGCLAGRRLAGRGRPGRDACGDADVPLRQPGRAPRAGTRRVGLRHGPCSGGSLDTVARSRRCPGGPGLPHQDAAGRRRGPGSGGGVPAGGAHRSASPRGPAAGGGRRPGRGGGMVGGCCFVVALLVPAVHRRLADQQHPGADLRLQRPGTADGRRDGKCGWGSRGRAGCSKPVGRHRSASDVQLRDGRPDRVAATGRTAARRRRLVDHPSGQADRSAAGIGAAVGRLARRDRPGLQLGQGDHPSLLHGGSRSGDRGLGRDRGGLALAAPTRVAGALPDGGGAAGDRRVGGCPAGALPVVAPRAEDARARLWGSRRCRCAAAALPAAVGCGRSRPRGPGHRAGGAGRRVPADGCHQPHRRHPFRRSCRRGRA